MTNDGPLLADRGRSATLDLPSCCLRSELERFVKRLMSRTGIHTHDGSVLKLFPASSPAG